MQIPLKSVRQQRGTVYPRTEYPSGEVDAAALEADLRAAVRGEVRFDAGSRALYATDGSIYRQVPIGVVLPRDADDVVAAVAACAAPARPAPLGTAPPGMPTTWSPPSRPAAATTRRSSRAAAAPA